MTDDSITTAPQPPPKMLDRVDRRTINGFIVLFGMVGIIYILIFHPPPTEAKDFLLMLLGLLGGMAKDVISYDFGSSAGSEKKDAALIGNMTPPLVPVPPISAVQAQPTQPPKEGPAP